MTIANAANGFGASAGPGRLLDGPAAPLPDLVETGIIRELAGTPCLPKVVSLVAPTGSGKTVAMSQLHARLNARGERCHWIWVDDQDASLNGLLLALLQCTVTATPGQRPLADPQEAIGIGSGFVVAALSGLGEPATIFIDNLDFCSDPRLERLLDDLIFRTPPDLRFVWSGTVDLPVNRVRAKLGNLIQEVGYEQLALSLEETGTLLGRKITTRIGQDAVNTIHDRTEGWVAGIRVVQIMLASSPEPLTALAAFSGTDRDVTDLFGRQVLMAFPEDLQYFLLCLSQLRVFNADLLVHVTGNADAGAQLDTLIRCNAFVIALDRNRSLFRLHKLFRDSLRQRARRELPDDARVHLLSAAAHWCEQRAEWLDAACYALDAGDLDHVNQILERSAPVLVRDMGRIQAYVGLVDHLLSARHPIGIETQYWYAYALIFHRRYANATRHHDQLVALIEQQSSNTRELDGTFPLRLEHLRICIAFLKDELSDAMDSASAWLAAPGHKALFDVGWVMCIKAICHLTSYKFNASRQALREAEPFVSEMGSPYITGWVSLVRGTIDLYEGNPAAAHRIISAALIRARRELGDDASICDTMALIAAKAASDMCMDGEALELLTAGFRSARHHGTVGSTALGIQAALALWNGADNDPGFDLESLQDIVRSYPPRLALMLSCSLVRRLIAVGRLDEALAEASRIGLDLTTGTLSDGQVQIPRCRELIAATAIDLLIATNHDTAAGAMIAREYDLAHTEGRAERLVDLDLARALLHHRTGRPDLARRHLIAAIRLAAPRALLRLFADRMTALTRLLQDQPVRPHMFATHDEQDFLRRLELISQAEGSGSQAWSAGSAELEAPTPREIELLKLVDMGFSNKEISDHTQISVATIKWHLKNVYRKFDVSSRTAAVSRARSIGILTR